jgi:polyhydroxyalkanoate synthesis regulator phasin
MARSAAPDLIGKLVDKGEEALQRVTEAPAAHRLLETVTTLRGRVDELQRRVRGLDALERRVAALEKKVDTLAKKPAPPRKPAAKAAAKPAAKKTAS